jgi:hypothetical protein
MIKDVLVRKRDNVFCRRKKASLSTADWFDSSSQRESLAPGGCGSTLLEAAEGAASYAIDKAVQKSAVSPQIFIPELVHIKSAALSTLASVNTRRAYKHAIDRFISWYCSEPRLGFNRTIVLRYRSSLESLQLSAATINLHLSAIRRLADEAAENGSLSPELAIGIRRVKGVKRLGRRIGNWLTQDQAQGY